MVERLLWSALDSLFRGAHLNFGFAPGKVPTIRVEVTLPDGRWVASYFAFDTTVGEVVTEMSTLVEGATEEPDAG
jgi:hypothetical protein